MTEKYNAHPKNVSGVFYVVNGCCTACGVPDALAPALFAYDQDNHCYVRRQPATVEELESTLDVIVGQELGCIRYRGKDEDILRRLAEVGESAQCDEAPPKGIVAGLRNHVTFQAGSSDVSPFSSRLLLEELRRYVVGRRQKKIQATSFTESSGEASLSIWWVKEQRHAVIVRQLSMDEPKWLLRHTDHIGLSRLVDEWLKHDSRFINVQWFTQNDWYGAKHWRPRPW